MGSPTVLWADLTINGSSETLKKQFARRCDVRTIGPRGETLRQYAAGAPHFIFLEYDYPDKRGLNVLRRVKRTHPSVPLIMITLGHSEALAVWSFRAGAWDYLTKPVTSADVDRVCDRMRKLVADRTPFTRRLPALVESAPPVDTQYVARSGADRQLAPAVRYIESHFAEKITETRLAGLCGMNTFRFSRAFRECYGMTFREALLRYRIKAARRLLENPSLTITQVAFMTGFSDSSHFGKMFRRFHGQTATDYRCEIADRQPADAKPLEWPTPTEEELRVPENVLYAVPPDADYAIWSGDRASTPSNSGETDTACASADTHAEGRKKSCS